MPSYVATKKRRSAGSFEKKYCARADTPAAWFPWGVLQLIVLSILFLIGALLLTPRIEADVRTQVSDRLHEAGITSAMVSSSGQGVTIRASAGETDEKTARLLAGYTQCETWAGRLRCPTTVDVMLDEPEAKTAELEMRPHPFTISRRNGAVILSGDVPSLEEQDRILINTRQRFENISSDLYVTGAAASNDYVTATDTAIAAVSHLQQGQAKWSGESLSVIGFGDQSGIESARRQVDAIGHEVTIGVFNVSGLNDTS